MGLHDISDSVAGLLTPISQPIARTLSLSRLPTHFPTVLSAFAIFQVVELTSPVFLKRVSPIHFGRADARLKHNWVVHVVSMVHALIIIPLAWFSLDSPELERDKAFAFNASVGRLFAIACGFIWDTLDSIVYLNSIGFIVHGFVCLVVYAMSFRPFLGFYGARFLLWELSTPFLNIHWFLDKTNRTGGTLQIVNGIILLMTFLLVRLCYGGWMSLQFFYTLNDVRSQIPTEMAIAYGLGNVALQVLNWFWFCKMLLALSRRFPKTPNGHSYINGNVRADENKIE